MTTKRDPLIVTMPDTRPAREAKLKALWEQLLAQKPTNDQLLEVIHTMEAFASAAYEELIKSSPPNDVLVRCLHCKDGDVSVKAGKRILANDPTNSDLAQLVNWGDDDTADKAWKKLLWLKERHAVANETFREIITSSCHNVAGYHDKRKFRELAAKVVLESNHSNADLICIMEHCELLSSRAMLILVRQNPTKDDFCKVLEKVRHEPVIGRAMAELLDKAPNNDELVKIITTHSSDNNSWQKKALEKLWEQNPTKEQLGEIIKRGSKEFRNQAWERFIQFSPSEDELLEFINSNGASVMAAQILRGPKQSRKALRLIIEWASGDYSQEYKVNAANKLLEMRPSENDLLLIYKHVDSLSAEVQKLLPPKSAAEILQQMRNMGA